MFPGYEGQLRAYDVTGIALASTGGSTIQTISTADPLSPTGRNVTAGGSILWDAGQLLASRSQSNRTIYAGYRANSTSPYQRVDFTEANVNTLKTLLNDSNGDNAGLIRFIRGENRTWKLGDILHSSPVLMGPPSGDSTALGSSYAAFVTANAGRTPVIFVGANDGMLHCFDLSTGAELWGFIPYNLLPKIKNMSAWDSAAHVRYYAHDYFVDGTPTVGDVYFGGNWRTVLMCGQGAGKGSTVAGGLNYYFALDVTDPTNPLVLWEAKDSTTMGETWSVPAFGQVLSSSTYYWVAFVGSGYDNDTTRTVGNRFYIIRLDTGAILKTLTVTTDVNTSLSSKCPHPYTNIQVTVPGSPAAVDTNRDGRTEYVYFGDLDGRFYRLPLTSSNTSNWTLQTIYTDRVYYPIITKPAIYPDPSSGGLPLGISFGTGGDDNAPADRSYAFIAMKDTGSSASVEWYLGNAVENLVRSRYFRQNRLFQLLDGEHRKRQPLPEPRSTRPAVCPFRPDGGRERHRLLSPQIGERVCDRKPPVGQQSPESRHGRGTSIRRRVLVQERSLHPGIRFHDRTAGTAGRLVSAGCLLARNL
ncbi:MAG: PilC/PilY family type IV pilus protein [Candidatus Aminicenantes bacterium]|nr:PilC/PilY family type IV pilus protein [Candidatus Aminicenantes bacterium]